MAYPKQRRRYPKPAPVTVRKGDEVTRLPADTFGHGPNGPGLYAVETELPMELAQEMFALGTGDALISNDRVFAGVWWFVKTVNGPEQTITAQTIIFDHVYELTRPFVYWAPVKPSDPVEVNEARERLGMARRDWDDPAFDLSEMLTGVADRHRFLLKPYPKICHGFANGCDCPCCGSMALSRAA